MDFCISRAFHTLREHSLTRAETRFKELPPSARLAFADSLQFRGFREPPAWFSIQVRFRVPCALRVASKTLSLSTGLLPGSSHGVFNRSPPPPSSCASTPQPFRVVRPTGATCRSRSVLTVSHRLNGFLRAGRYGFVAPRYRPWGSPGFQSFRFRVHPFPTGAIPYRGFSSSTAFPLAWSVPSCRWCSSSPRLQGLHRSTNALLGPPFRTPPLAPLLGLEPDPKLQPRPSFDFSWPQLRTSCKQKCSRLTTAHVPFGSLRWKRSRTFWARDPAWHRNPPGFPGSIPRLVIVWTGDCSPAASTRFPQAVVVR